jgi:hypothetical protein
MAWHSANDELCIYAGEEGPAALIDRLDALGYRYDSRTFAGPEHFAFSIYAAANSQDLANFFGARTVERDPAHVAYVVNPRSDEPRYGLEADHAYWVSHVQIRSTAGAAPMGRIDVVSRGFGVADATPQATQRGPGVLSDGPSGSGFVPGLPYAGQSRSWGAPSPARPRDRLEIDARNVRAFTVDASRAQVSCHPDLALRSDGPLTVTFTGCRDDRHWPSRRPRLVARRLAVTPAS